MSLKCLANMAINLLAWLMVNRQALSYLMERK